MIETTINRVKNYFDSNLWTNNNRLFYGRAYRNIKDKMQIAEVHISGNNYKEVMFDSKIDALCFFDPSETIENVRERPVQEVNIIFAVNLDKIYPNESIRPTSKVQNDVVNMLNDNYLGADVNYITEGLKAYGTISTDHLKAYHMHPYWTFSVNTTMILNFKDC